ncbi:MAG: ATP-binding cassette domain-containing protein [Crocinitomicaceae bacterium]|jgi:ABC-2 type transport system ATP-binding protein|nr:ATP-binding cassette domain-containing protein [Crocinitomicaceae bacterium]
MLEISGIAKSYQQNTALRNVSFHLNEGEIYTLLGPNGAGKSTLIRIINRILEPDSGWIKYQKDLFKEEHLKNFGYLPEERGLYGNMTVEEHGIFLAQLRGMNRKEAKQNLNYWLERFQITDWRKKRIQELSKGMAQKIQFIYTVLHQPKVIILDEPFSGFDPLNVELMKKEILHLKEEGRAILISTHNMNSVEEIGDRGMLLNQGKTILEGAITDMRKQQSSGEYTVRFSGSMIAFVNALWTGFEIVEKRELPNNRHEVDVKVRNENTINELMHVLINQVEVEAIETKIPRMHDVFVQAIQNANTH